MPFDHVTTSAVTPRDQDQLMANRIQILTFGGLQIHSNGVPVRGLASRKAEALLIYLLCTRRSHAREVLANLLWDDLPRRRALGNLSVLLSSLRQHFGNILTSTPHQIAFNPSATCELDVHLFEAQLTLGYTEPTATTLRPAAITAREVALACYQGDFLHGFTLRDGLGFETWMLAEQERLRQLALTARVELVRSYLTSGEFPAGIHHATHVLQIDPLHEETQGMLIQMLAFHGQRGAALSQYERYRQILHAELGDQPGPEIQRIYDQIWQGDLRPTTTPTSLSPTPNDSHIPPFVGREYELAQITAHFNNPNCRLLTLVGPGGIGKTRLALQAQQHNHQLFPHGSAFVPLAAVSQHAGIVPALGNALGITFSGKSTPFIQLLDFLRDKHMLLVLDNMEHLLDNLELVQMLLSTAPNLRLLITSRERLNLRAEWLFEIGGMSYPHDPITIRSLQTDPTQIEHYSALCFFAQQARKIVPHFQLDADYLQPVIQLCQLVDGMPLALELAAALLPRMSCAQLVTTLQHNLDALSTNMRDMPRRHRSMRAVFDHSWQLLQPIEQVLFQQLAIFRGSFSPEAATMVVNLGEHHAQRTDTMLDQIHTLVDKSLVRSRSDGRYDLHELARQYAAQHLETSPTLYVTTQQCHCAYYVTTMERWMSQFTGSAQRIILTEINVEMDNLRAAWEWAITAHDLTALIALLPGLSLFYDYASRFQEAFDLFEQTLATLRQHKQLTNRLQGLLLSHLGLFAERLGRYAVAVGLARQAQLQFDSAAEVADYAFALSIQGRALERQGLFADAIRCFETSLHLSQTVNDATGIARAFYQLGSAFEGIQEYERAKTFTEESLARRSALGDRRGMAFTLNNLGIINEMLGDYTEASRLYRESLAFFTDLDDIGSTLLPISNLGDVAVALHDFTVGQIYYQRGLEIALRHAITAKAMMLLVKMALLFAQRGETRQALETLALPIRHPATEQTFKQQAENLVVELSSHIEPTFVTATLDQAAQRSLADTVALLLDEAKSTNRRSVSG
jgi:predicted ATPase/DNA-binding SARP family transcriptional activator